MVGIDPIYLVNNNVIISSSSFQFTYSYLPFSITSTHPPVHSPPCNAVSSSSPPSLSLQLPFPHFLFILLTFI